MKKKPEDIDVEEVAYHRNGVGGEGFHVVKFRDELTESPDGDTHMVAVVFDEPGAVAVFDRELLGMGMIAFGQNSWRGDNYEPVLREAIAHHESDNRERSDCGLVDCHCDESGRAPRSVR